MNRGMEEERQKEQTPIDVLFYHCDHLGTPIALTDRQGQIAWAARHDPWGNQEEEFNPHGIEQDIRLPGQHLDRETGLYYNRYRYYDPFIGSYVNQDPIGIEGGANVYIYSNNPSIWVDPLGLFELCATRGPYGPFFTFDTMPEVINGIRQTVDKATKIPSALLPGAAKDLGKKLDRANQVQEVEDEWTKLTCSGDVDSKEMLKAAACDSIVDQVLAKHKYKAGTRASGTHIKPEEVQPLLDEIKTEFNKTEKGKACAALYDWSSIMPNAIKRVL